MSDLFDPLKIGNIKVSNRIVFAPTQTLFGTDDGSVTDQSICFYLARAKGGVGLIIVEGAMVTDRYSMGGISGLGCYKDSQIRGLEELTRYLHAFGVVVILQLAIGLGRQAMFPEQKRELVSSSALACKISNVPRFLKRYDGMTGAVPRALTGDEVRELEELFGAAALRAKKAGFDGIEIHGAHGHLLAQFLSPLSNQRQDMYGGSFEKRLTLAKNLIRRAREKVGRDFLIGFRLSGDEHVEGGLSLEDNVKIATILEKEGLDFIHLSSGRYEAFRWTLPDEEGMMLLEAKAIKEVVRIPVICPNIHSPSLALKAIREGMVDAVSLSRGLLADPRWPDKVKGGKWDSIRHCTFCGTCFQSLLNGFMIRCSVNPELGKERFIPSYHPK